MARKKITIDELNEIRSKADMKPVKDISQRMINILHKEASEMLSVIGKKVELVGAMGNTSADAWN